MNQKDPIFWTACRLHRVLSGLPRSPSVWQVHGAAQDLAQELAVLSQVNHLLQRAASLSWAQHCRSSLQQRVLAAAARVSAASAAVLARGEAVPAPPLLPGIPDLIDDLRQLHAEFSRVTLAPREGGNIKVMTPPIRLQDVELGPFEIQLKLNQLPDRMDASAFTITALDPNPTGSSDDVSHPHVKDEQLCAGDATVPIAQALAHGRITDAFCLVSAVLHTYNAQSAYVGLEDWSGPTCGDCGRSVTRGETYSCDGCGGEYCDRCTTCCIRCDSSFCMSCLSENADGDLICRDCARTCRTCGARADAAALRRQDGQCTSCVPDEEEALDDVDDEDRGDRGASSVDVEAGAQEELLPAVPASAGASPSPAPNPLPETSHEPELHEPAKLDPLVIAPGAAGPEHQGREAHFTADIGTFASEGEPAFVPLAPHGGTAPLAR